MTNRSRRRFLLVALPTLVVIGLAAWAKTRFLSPGVAPVPLASSYASPSPDAVWPWKGAKVRPLARGVTQTSKVTADGTLLDLFDFDFGANPNLRWEIFDQDEDDARPLDNHVLYWERNVARATKELDGVKKRGPVLVAWNGAFFGYNNKTGVEDAFHVSPIVLRGKAYFNFAQHRWTFGVKNTPTGPIWKTFFKPDKATMEREFDYAAGSVQCLIKDGKPLKVEPFPRIGGQFKAQPVPSTAQDAGHIPYFDHMRTCRASIGWSRDNKHLYLLAVKEPDDEGASSVALSFTVRGNPLPPGTTLGGGWTVPDVQRFWQAKGVWGAINSDAGGVLQWVARQPNGRGWEMVPPRQGSNALKLQVKPNWNGAISGGGAMMYFFVREETPAGTPN
ncbi:hypothetical protein IAD21_05368 [Abditibacteriota bacterium]|nr:hypothetical protein IAD21_05368 [Abditibacteriota bacterium]